MSADEIMSMLQNMKQEQDSEFESNVISGTISKLLEIEKKALYGRASRKTQKQEEIILEGLNKYKESQNADSKN